MATFDRGFKIWAERTSVGIRREIGVRPEAPLPAGDLASFLGVELLTPNEIPGLPTKQRQQLLQTDPSGWSAVTIELPSRHLVIYNPRHSTGRQASDQMHEMAHILIGHPPSRMIMSPSGDLVMRSYDQKQEDEAAWLSGCLLLPREALLYIAKRQILDDAVCEQYSVSRPMLISRRNLSGVALQLQRRTLLQRRRRV